MAKAMENLLLEHVVYIFSILYAFYLANPTVDCDVTCESVDPTFVCSKLINTKNSADVFLTAMEPSDYTEKVDIVCDLHSSNAEYESSMGPYYDSLMNTCNGFKSVPEKINCTSPGYLAPNIRRLCYCVDKETMAYLPWAEWSPCSVRCGGGKVTRHRDCSLGTGCTNTMDQKDCNTHLCPVNGNWGNWTELGGCDVSCGLGKQMRQRSCINPEPRHGGEECKGVGVDYEHGCNPFPCPIHGQWGPWYSVETCSQPCGRGGVKPKSRYCDNPAPKYNGNYCVGPNVVKPSCNTNVTCKLVKVNLKVKLTKEKWNYTMFYHSSQNFKAVSSKFINAINVTIHKHGMTKGRFLEAYVNSLSKGSVIVNFTLKYNAIPFDELILVQDTVDRVGYVGTMPVQHIGIESNDVPEEVPQFECFSDTYSSINITWHDVDKSNIPLHGEYYAYYVYYRLVRTLHWESIGTVNTSIIVKNLTAGSLYGIRMLVSIQEGNGVASKEVLVRTKEGVPLVKPPSLSYQVIDSDTLYLSWGNIPNQQVPGVLRGHILSYHSHAVNITKEYPIAQGILHTTLIGLKPFSHYQIELRGYTYAGMGPSAYLTLQMPPGAPGVVPPNVQHDDMSSTDFVNIFWDPIPLLDQNGYMKGYKIRYQLIEHQNMEVIYDNSVLEAIVDKYTHRFTIRKLKLFSKYKVEVCGYADEGDGPAAIFYASTCKCPAKLFTNFYEINPYVKTNKYNDSMVTGLFPQILSMIFNQICSGCSLYEQPEVDYVSTLTGHSPKKMSKVDVRKYVDSSVHLTFPVYLKFEFQKFYGMHPYIGIIYSQGTAMIVINQNVRTIGLLHVMKTIASAWTVVVVAVLLSCICGWLFWFLEQTSQESDLTINQSIVGAFQGLWVAIVTMTTVGYGDFVPTTNSTKALTIVWTLCGLVIVSLFTGIVSSGMTISNMDEDIKLYGTKTAAVHETFEQQLAIRRNAIVIPNITNTDDVIDAVVTKKAVVGLLESRVAKSHEQKILNSGLKIHDVLDAQSGYGIVLSGELEAIEEDFRSFVYAKQRQIQAFVDSQVEALQPTVSKIETEIFSNEQMTKLIIRLTACIGIFSVLGIGLWLCRCKNWRTKVRVADPALTSEDLANELSPMVEGFCQKLKEKLQNLQKNHSQDIISLQDLRNNYLRLLKRSGIERSLVEKKFKANCKKSVNKILKERRNKLLGTIVEK